MSDVVRTPDERFEVLDWPYEPRYLVHPDGLPVPQRYWSMLAIAIGIAMTVLDAAVARYGTGLDAVIAFSAVWLNGEPASREMPVGDSDEVAVLPPVSGG